MTFNNEPKRKFLSKDELIENMALFSKLDPLPGRLRMLMKMYLASVRFVV